MDGDDQMSQFVQDNGSGDRQPVIWGGVPLRNPNFTGRKELLDLLAQRLEPGTTAVLPAALHGMGGVGKTQIAVEYIYGHLQDYDLVWWIPATDPDKIRASLTELARHLGLAGSDAVSTAVPAVREALRLGRPHRRWLLVFDSAQEPEAVCPFFPAGGSGRILVTSRNPGWSGAATSLDIPVFRRAESRELLSHRVPALSVENADLIAQKVGDLPLGLEQAAAWSIDTGMPPLEYVRRLDAKTAEIPATSAPQGYERPPAEAWNVSLDELEGRNPPAYELLAICAFFAAGPVARSWFKGARAGSLSPILDPLLHDELRLSGAIGDINRLGLAKLDHGHETLELHRMVQLAVRKRLSEERQAELRHQAHLLLANLDPDDPASVEHWPRYQELLPHVVEAVLADSTDPGARRLVINLVKYLNHWGDDEGALALAEQARGSWESGRLERKSRGEAPIDEPPAQELLLSERVAFLLWSVGRYAGAEKAGKRTVDRYLEFVGPNSEDTINAQLTHALILKARGEFGAARQLNEEICRKAEGLFGPDDPIALAASHDFVVALLLTGEYRAAADRGRETYERRCTVLGEDHVSTIGTRVLLVIARRELGHHGWARAEQELVVAQPGRKRQGDDGPGALRHQRHLSIACRKDGARRRARDLSGSVYERSRARHGADHPDTLAAALAHSVDLRLADQLEEARNLGGEVHDRYRRCLGELHPHTLAAAVDLGVTLRLQNDPGAAHALDERSFEEFRSQLGEDHPFTIACAINLASDLSELGKIDAAAKLDAELTARSERVLGADHPITLAVRLNRALDLRALGNESDADVLLEDVLGRYRRVLGESDAATVAASEGVRADCDLDPMPL